MFENHVISDSNKADMRCDMFENHVISDSNKASQRQTICLRTM